MAFPVSAGAVRLPELSMPFSTRPGVASRADNTAPVDSFSRGSGSVLSGARFGGHNYQRLQNLARDGVVQTAPTTKQRPALTLPNGMLLSEGSEGSKVRRLQTTLNRTSGSKLQRDGDFGPKTEGAVRRFQEKHGLDVDGIVGPKTLKVLNREHERAASKRATRLEEWSGTRQPVAPPSVKTAASVVATAAEPVKTPAPVVAKAPEPVKTPAPAVAKAAEPVKTPAPLVPKAAEPVAKAAEPPKPAPPEFGLAPQTLSALEKNGKLGVLRKLPKDISGRYSQLSPNMKTQFYTQLSGSTFGVSHRDAFVRGTAMGMDTFNLMGEKLTAAAQQGKITPKEAAAIQGDLAKLRNLSPTERDAVAEVIMLQRGR